MSPRLRRLLPLDVPALAVFAEACFREAFGAEFPPEAMERICARAFDLAVMEGLVAQGTWLAEEAGTPLGYIAFGSVPCPLEGLAPPTAELARLYVRGPSQGTGVADALMEAFLGAARTRGYGSAWLQAYEKNPRALAFYRRWGFRDHGPFTVAAGGLLLPHRALALDL